MSVRSVVRPASKGGGQKGPPCHAFLRTKKKHWNTVYLDSDVPDPLIRELVDHSYDLIVESLPEGKRPG